MGFERVVEVVFALNADVAVEDLSEAYAGVVLSGPLAAQLAVSPAARLAGPVMVVGRGEEQRLLVLPAWRADSAWQVLLEAGRRLGGVAVDLRAADLHSAAQHALAAQPRRAPPSAPPIEPITTGAQPT